MLSGGAPKGASHFFARNDDLPGAVETKLNLLVEDGWQGVDVE